MTERTSPAKLPLSARRSPSRARKTVKCPRCGGLAESWYYCGPELDGDAEPRGRCLSESCDWEID